MKSKTVLRTVFTLSVIALSTQVHAKGREGNGGDICEDRFKLVRDDIASWIEKGGSSGLTLPHGVTLARYNEQMLKYISDPMNAPKYPFKASIQCTSDKVFVDRAEKTCRNDKNPQTGAASIVCNSERFNNTNESDQYVLVHHEYAGLAGIEVNSGQESHYTVSNQISGYLESETVKKLAIKPMQQGRFYTAEGESSFSKECSDWSYKSWEHDLKQKAVDNACENAKEQCYGDYSSSHPDRTFFCEPVMKKPGLFGGGAHGSDGDCDSGAYTEAEADATCTVEVIFTRPE